ncbi:type II secretion system F family protein [Idiomarina seosinensis]|uniref:Pilus assembly protein TadC n=1 Tax=Idiomarina seosinensis TaxID=281739 RepID=A0A432ZGX7_9GAMM|nr:type II secretion system F family protein [Idiomarina seosinensis]RUO77267.1 pilus assembly protein TadC [Idiomarina seosinensis]
MLLLLLPLIFLCTCVISYALLRLWQWLNILPRLDRLSEQCWRRIPGQFRRRLGYLFDSEGRSPTVHRFVSSWTLVLVSSSVLAVMTGLGMLLLALVLLLLFQISRNQNRFARKQRQIKMELPDFCDLLAMMIAAGIPLIPAMSRVSEACQGGLLAAEVSRVNHQLRQGTPFSEALNRLADFYRLPLLSEWTGLLIQGHQQGSSLVTTLRFHSLQMRQQLLNEAEKKAQEAPVKLLFPLMTCFFPVNFLVILGPIVLQISEGGF